MRTMQSIMSDVAAFVSATTPAERSEVAHTLLADMRSTNPPLNYLVDISSGVCLARVDDILVEAPLPHTWRRN